MSYRPTATLTTATLSEAQAYDTATKQGFALLASPIDCLLYTSDAADE